MNPSIVETLFPLDILILWVYRDPRPTKNSLVDCTMLGKGLINGNFAVAEICRTADASPPFVLGECSMVSGRFSSGTADSVPRDGKVSLGIHPIV